MSDEANAAENSEMSSSARQGGAELPVGELFESNVLYRRQQETWNDAAKSLDLSISA